MCSLINFYIRGNVLIRHILGNLHSDSSPPRAHGSISGFFHVRTFYFPSGPAYVPLVVILVCLEVLNCHSPFNGVYLGVGVSKEERESYEA